MFSKDTSHNIFIDIGPERLIDLLCDPWATEAWIASFQFDDGLMSSGEGPSGPGFRLGLTEYSCRYLRCLSRRWNFSSVEGRRITAACWIWRGLRKSDQNPSSKRSTAVKLGAHRRTRFMMRICCFISRLSATMAFAPPGLRSLAIVVSRWTRSMSRSFMAWQGGRATSHPGQVRPDYCFRVKITNSPQTPCRRS